MWNIKKIISKGDYLYALVLEHPNCTKNGYVLMHRVVMENHLGRLLNANEIVHHIDHNKHNNDISNLEVMTNREHARNHAFEKGQKYVKLKCPVCKKIFDIPRRASFLQQFDKRVIKCTCCSRSCSATLFHLINKNGLTHEMETAISENVLLEYR